MGMIVHDYTTESKINSTALLWKRVGIYDVIDRVTTVWNN